MRASEEGNVLALASHASLPFVSMPALPQA